MKYNIKVTNRETKTVWFHDEMSKDDIGWIKVDPNLLIEIQSEYKDEERRDYRIQEE